MPDPPPCVARSATVPALGGAHTATSAHRRL